MRIALIIALCIAFVAASPLRVSKNKAIPEGSCGQNKYGGLYIVGGEDAKANEFPFQVSLERTSHTCGGSIIDKQWILSAAHCFSNDNPSSWTVVVGMHNLYASSEETRKDVYVEKIIVHEEYRPFFSNKNDLALMKLKEPLVFDENVQPVCLADKDYKDVTNKDVIATGWGTTTQGGYLANTLQKVSVPVISNAECADAYSSESIYDSMICAGDLQNGGIDSCQGDSGGPLTYFDATARNNSFVQVGITSWGYGCAQKGYPGVYTRVSEFYDWIWKTVTSN